MNHRDDRDDRVFLDANVLFSMAYAGAVLAKLVNRASPRGPALITSAYAWEEVRRNLSCVEHRRRLEALAPHFQFVPSAPPDMPCPLDLPDKDRPVFLAALQGGASHFLTGDRRHFGRYYGTMVRGVRICSPAQYLRATGL